MADASLVKAGMLMPYRITYAYIKAAMLMPYTN
jgi:hypothetical protein